jgi:hypothetical protein
MPALVGAIQWLSGLSTLNAALLFNLVCLTAAIWLAAQLIKVSGLHSPVWFYALLAALAILVSLQSLAANVATEPLFLVLVLAFLLCARRYHSQPTWTNLLWMALPAALAPILRWVGVTLIFAGCAMLLLRHWRAWRTWLRHSLAFGALASTPLLAWVFLRQIPRTGSWFGPRQTQFDFIEPLGNVAVFYARISEWLLPNTLTKRVDLAFFLLALAGLLLLWNSRDAWRAWARELFATPNLALIVFSVVYFIFMALVVATREHTDSFDDRYLLPLFVPLLILFFLTLDRLLLPRLSAWGRWGRALLVGGLALWLAYHGFLTGRFIQTSLEEGVAYYNLYNIRAYRESPFVQTIQAYSFAEGLQLYSNDAPAVYFYTGRPVRNSLDDSQSYTARDEHVRDEAESWPPEPQAYLLWLLPNWKEHYFTPAQLEQVSELEPLLQLESGGLYLARPR